MATYNGMPLATGGAPTNAMGLNPGQPLGMEAFDPEIHFENGFQM
jgi:hypothetical protein